MLDVCEHDFWHTLLFLMLMVFAHILVCVQFHMYLQAILVEGVVKRFAGLADNGDPCFSLS
jgi:hypothetical protein